MGWWNNKGKGRGPMSKLAPAKTSPEEAKRLVPVIQRHPCDRCGVSEIDGGVIAHARYEIKTPSGSIYLCKHHYDKHSLVLLTLDYKVSEHGGAAA